MSNGWISLHRQIWDNEIWDDKPFARGQAWIDLLLLVNHEPRKIVIGKSLVFVGRGSTVTSIRKLAERWGWSRTKVADFLNSLQSADMLKFKSDTKKTVLTIANYSFFQDCEKEKSHKNATEKPQKSTNNNDNNANKPIYAQNGFEEFWKAYPKKRSKQEALKSWNKLKPTQELYQQIISAVNGAKTSQEWLKDNGQYIPYPATWLNQGRWEDELTDDAKPKQRFIKTGVDDVGYDIGYWEEVC